MRLLSSIPLQQLPILQPLVRDYIQGSSQLAPLYNLPPHLSSFAQMVAVREKQYNNRSALADIVQSQYVEFSPASAVDNNIAKLRQSNCFTVTSSHQPCLFIGPLYNIYKICCTIKLSQQLQIAYPDKHFVPVFWLGTEDHDVEELNHAYVNGQKVQWDNSGSGVSGKWSTATLHQQLQNIGWKTGNESLDKILLNSIERFAEFGPYTQNILHELFKDFGLVVIDQNDVNLKKLFVPVIEDEILHQRVNKVLTPTLQFLETHYKVQATPRPINFFYLMTGKRERLLFDESKNVYTVNNTAIQFTSEEIQEEIINYPERFSPNVIMRPLYQEFILPNLAFVGGSGELSYWLQLKPLFQHFNIPYPIQMLRSSATILTVADKRKLDKLQLGIEHFFGTTDDAIRTYLQINLSDNDTLLKQKEEAAAIFDTIIEKATNADVTLKNSAAAEKQKTLAAIDNLESKMLKAEKRRQENAVQQIRSVHQSVFPGGVLQERRENFVPFYSPDFIKNLIDNFDAFNPHMHVFIHSIN